MQKKKGERGEALQYFNILPDRREEGKCSLLLQAHSAIVKNKRRK